MTWPKKEIYPIFYFNRRGVDKDGKPFSDKGYVLKMMSVIPLEHKRKIADRYEILYQKPSTTNNRKRANTFLNKVARWFHNKSKSRKTISGRGR